MADQICTRFGALDCRLAAAVRHALDTATTHPALFPMNAVHLRMILISEVLDSEPFPEPPSHRWYEFMVECFGRNPIGFQNFSSQLGGSWSNATVLEHVSFAESYVTSKIEDRVIHDLLVAASTFLVAESMAMDEQIEQWTTVGSDDFDSEEFYVILGRAGAVGINLLKHAEAGTWRDLLRAGARGPDSVVINAEKVQDPPTPTLSCVNASKIKKSSDSGNADYVVLMVDSVEASHRAALTTRALSELREAANNYNESNPKDSVVVVSAADGRMFTPLPLTSYRSDKSPEDDSFDKQSIEHTLDQVAEMVEVLSQPVDGVSTIAASITRPLGRQKDLITGMRTATRTYEPVLLIILSSGHNSISQCDLRSDPDPGSGPRELVDTLRDHSLLPDLRGVSVVFLWSAPSLEAYLGAYWLAICAAAGALSCEFRFSSPKRGLSVAHKDDTCRLAKVGAREPPTQARNSNRPVIAREGRVQLCDEDSMGPPVDNRDSSRRSDPSKRAARVTESPTTLGLLSYILHTPSAGHRIWRTLIFWRTLILMIFTVAFVVLGTSAMKAMIGSIHFLAAGTGMAGLAAGMGIAGVALLVFGVLIGSSLHTKSIDSKYRRLAQLNRQHNRGGGKAIGELTLPPSAVPLRQQPPSLRR